VALFFSFLQFPPLVYTNVSARSYLCQSQLNRWLNLNRSTRGGGYACGRLYAFYGDYKSPPKAPQEIEKVLNLLQARISWGIHGLLEVSLGSAMPYNSMKWLFQWWLSYYVLGYPIPYGPDPLQQRKQLPFQKSQRSIAWFTTGQRPSCA
jgi:hypothetical protein